MSHVRRSILARIIATSLITLSACQGSMQNVGQVPSAPMHGANSGNALASKGEKRSNTTTGYTLTDLGALPGDSDSTVSRGLNGISPFGGNPLNNAGQVAGTSYGPNPFVATLFSNGTAVNLNTLNSSSSLAIAVNASGQVVGEEMNTACNCNHAFLYSNGAMQDINDNSLFPGGSAAIGNNKVGQIVGGGQINGSTVHAFLFSNGKLTDINPFSGSSSNAVSINDSSQIIGSSGNTNLTGTWLLSNGTVTVLSQTIDSFFINDDGQIVGQNQSNFHGALYSNGTWKDLGSGPPGATGSAAFSINTSGQIVGFAGFPGSSHPFRPATQHAIIFNNNGATDLNSLIPPNSGYKLNFAVGINDSGQIAVDATNSSKQKRAVLLTPK